MWWVNDHDYTKVSNQIVRRINSVQIGKYHDRWWPGSLRRQDNNTHDTDYVE